jgi:hypothetical protein
MQHSSYVGEQQGMLQDQIRSARSRMDMVYLLATKPFVELRPYLKTDLLVNKLSEFNIQVRVSERETYGTSVADANTKVFVVPDFSRVSEANQKLILSGSKP